MTPVCSCKQGPDRRGAGESEYCDRCKCWTREALEANRIRHERERSAS